MKNKNKNSGPKSLTLQPFSEWQYIESLESGIQISIDCHFEIG